MGDKPICESTIEPILWWNVDKIDFPDCKRHASVNIDGINLCLQHAGAIAIQILLNDGRCKKISENPRLCPISDRWVDKVKYYNKR